ncbi:MAG: cytochrome c [Desulfobulbaceae bacterium]|nr:cytochrome c [Desulfobulbaceae bacterium]
MQKGIRIFVVVFALIIGPAAVGQASPVKRFDPGTQTCRILGFDSMWWGDGAKIFQNNCKSCHYRGNDKGAKFLYAESKSPEAWNRVFFQKYPQCAKDGSWGALSLNDQLQLNDFLYRNGANTYNPNSAADCG